MLSILINFIFTILAKISDIILAPFFAVFSTFIPSFDEFTQGISIFLTSAISYFSFILKLFMIPQICITSVVTLALAYVSMRAVLATYSFLVRTWKTLKP